MLLSITAGPLDAQGVAELLGLSQRTAISVYQRRYPDMPAPVVILSRGRTRLWLKPEIVAWAKQHDAVVQVPPTERLIFLMHDVEGYDHARIARLLGVNEAESQTGLHQARIRIRQLVADMQ